MKCPFEGSWVAIPTPFVEGAIDHESLAGLVEFHAERGTEGLVVAGTSGEGPTLTDHERQSTFDEMVQLALDALVLDGAS